MTTEERRLRVKGERHEAIAVLVTVVMGLPIAGCVWVSHSGGVSQAERRREIVCHSPVFVEAITRAAERCDKLAVEYRNTNPEAGTIASVVVLELRGEISAMMQARDMVFSEHGWHDPYPDIRDAFEAGVRDGFRQRAIKAVLRARIGDDDREQR